MMIICNGCGNVTTLSTKKSKCIFCGLTLPYKKLLTYEIRIPGYGFTCISDYDIIYPNAYYCKNCGSDNVYPLELINEQYHIRCLSCKKREVISGLEYYQVKNFMEEK